MEDVGYRREAAALAQSLNAVPLSELMHQASKLRQAGHGTTISYSKKVFVPLTRLCRDVCGYCTFAITPRQVKTPFMTPDEVMEVIRQGEAAGCKEALFTLGDKPELRYGAAREHLRELGHETTIDYLYAICEQVIRKTSLLPHINAGIMGLENIRRLRDVSVSQGLMLESISERLCEKGGPHHGAPDKAPKLRLSMIEDAGIARVPFTSGILIGIGENREERIAALLALRDLHRRHGHLQEVIIQNFRAKAETRMAENEEPEMEDLLWTAAVARIVLGKDANIQVPPNLSYADFPRLLSAGINDWGGVSPVTRDFVNPEAPWPAIAKLEQATQASGLQLVERLAAYPHYVLNAAIWQSPRVLPRLLAASDAGGYAREGEWSPGGADLSPPPQKAFLSSPTPRELSRLIARAERGDRMTEAEIVRLFNARGTEVEDIRWAADNLRRQVSGEVVRYVVNRNINYTNLCSYKCSFCAFSKGKAYEHLRGAPYDLAREEIERRTIEAWQRGATEVCMQGGIHPGYSGQTYIDLLKIVKSAVPQMHVHAFSPLEVHQGAATLGLHVADFLVMLKDHGLGTLPGTAAEILDDRIRAKLCPDKISADRWFEVVEAAHRQGLRTTATIMFGHLDDTLSWARHLGRLRDLQERTGGFTEFVPLPFIHFEAPIYLRGQARRGPTWRETILMYAVSRLVLNPLIPNIQGSWVKLGPEGVAQALNAGANDLGGTLMDESISRAAGAEHGSEMPPSEMEILIRSCGRIPEQRTTLYQPVSEERRNASFAALPLEPVVQTPFRKDRLARPEGLLDAAAAAE
jgi:FO synthase